MDRTSNIGRASVGLVKGYGNATKVNAAAMDELNVRVKAHLGEEGGLRIAKIIEGRPRDANGTVPLMDKDVAKIANVEALGYTGTKVPGSAHKIRRIQNNIGLAKSLQVNTPVGNDIWINMDVIVVENNIADVNTAQFNYPISSSDFLESLRILKGR